MENRYQKWVILSYLSVSILFGVLFFYGALQLTSSLDLETRIKQFDLWVWGVSVFLTLVMFVILFRNHQANEFLNEVISELAKVTWPTQKETTSATFIVIIMVLISGMVLGLLDYLWTWLLKKVI